MSGVSLETAPRSEPGTNTKPEAAPGAPGVKQEAGLMSSLRVIELQLVALIMIFSASGLVPLLELIFPAFSSVYLILLSRLAFPSHGQSIGSPEIFQGSGLFRLYVILGTTVGLFVPLAYVLGGFARGDEHAVRSATPHLFLLSCQILTENIISGLSLFSPPVRALVPLLYTVRRIFVILDWVKDVWINKALPSNAPFQDIAWFWFGRMLASANMAYFSTSLFCFLIPRFLPRAFERYFREGNEICAKITEDKRSAAMNAKFADHKAD